MLGIGTPTMITTGQVGNIMTLSEVMRTITFLNHASSIGCLLYGGAALIFALSNWQTITGEVVQEADPQHNIEEKREHGLMQLLAKLKLKLFSDDEADIKEEEWLYGVRGLFYLAVLATSAPMALTGFGGVIGAAANVVGLSLPSALAMVGQLFGVIRSIHDYTGIIAMPLALTSIAFVFLGKYADAFHSRSVSGSRFPDRHTNVVVANSRLFLGFMLTIPAIVLGASSALGLIPIEFLLTAGPLLAIAALAWVMNEGLKGAKDMAYVVGGGGLLGLLATVIPEDHILAAILLAAEVIAAGFACYKIYKSVEEKRGILYMGNFTWDNFQHKVKEHGPTVAVKLAVITAPLALGEALGSFTVGAVLSATFALAFAGYDIYKNRDNWIETKPERTKPYIIAGSVAIFPALTSSSIALMSSNAPMAIISIAATAIIALGTLTSIFQAKPVEI